MELTIRSKTFTAFSNCEIWQQQKKLTAGSGTIARVGPEGHKGGGGGNYPQSQGFIPITKSWGLHPALVLILNWAIVWVVGVNNTQICALKL